ncbi:MAG: hypothetical protein ACP5OP_05195 [Leptospirillia bacterium]
MTLPFRCRHGWERFFSLLTHHFLQGVLSLGILLAGSSGVRAQIGPLGQTFEFDGGETVFSQNSQYFFAILGDFFPLSSPAASSKPGVDVGTAPLQAPSLHLFVVASYFAYETPGASGLAVNAYNGLTPAIGLRVPLSDGFVEGDVGVALANGYGTGQPVETLGGVYLQGEYYHSLGSGAMDLFSNYLGYIDYIYVQGRWLAPIWKGKSLALFLGPELIGQGNNGYNAEQGGAVLGLSILPLHSYLTFDGGLLRSSVSSGWGGYQGFSWYVSY